MKERIVIIGNGIAGITTARELRKQSDCEICVVGEETSYFFSRTALMYVFMGQLKPEQLHPYETNFWKKNGIDIIKDRVLRVQFDRKVISLERQGEMAYDKLVIASGSNPRQLSAADQSYEGVLSLHKWQDIEKLECQIARLQKSEKKIQAVVIGGGLIGAEWVEMLLSHRIEVTYLIREAHFLENVWSVDEAQQVQTLLHRHGVNLRLETELLEVIGNEEGQVRAVRTISGDEIKCDLLCLAIGVAPNIDFLKGTGVKLDNGVCVDAFLQTNIPGVYAIGDCAQHMEPPPGWNPIEALWHTGRAMGLCLSKTLAGTQSRYEPGARYYAAKFFDLEFQSFGSLTPRHSKMAPGVFYWEDMEEMRTMKFIFNLRSAALLGIAVFGIRLREPKVFEWLNKGISMDQVMQELEEANFNPEFTRPFSASVQRLYHEVGQKGKEESHG